MKRIFELVLVLLCALGAQAQDLNFEKPYLKAMEERLTPEQKHMLQSIHEPVEVLVPPSDARHNLCVLSDGEIRCYGEGNAPYYSSTSCGIDWQKHYWKGCMHSCTWIPEFGIYVKAVSERGEGTFIYISESGPDDENPTIIKISDEFYANQFLPVKLSQSDRVFFTAQYEDGGEEQAPSFWYSDDRCRTWNVVRLPVPPRFVPEAPHKWVRWSIGCGSEPNACELSDGRLMMLIRNSNNDFWWSFSDNQGTAWSEPEPSIFHGTLTTPFLLTMSDGRTVVFWNNARPLPEVDQSKLIPDVGDYVRSGRGEDVITNRDACHVAVSADGGSSWIGARELWLNEIRNFADFRYRGGDSSCDKSVHQFQAIELPYGKIMCEFGQNAASRRVVIFDSAWIEEQGRSEDFLLGLGNVSTHMYLKSISGSTFWKKDIRNGHCSANRTDGAVMAPDPDGGCGESVLLSRVDDPRLLYGTQGRVWNFPAAQSGEVSVRVWREQGDLRLSLADVWFNACDPCVGDEAQYSCVLGRKELGKGRWCDVTVNFDNASGSATVSVDGLEVRSLVISHPVSMGLSYLHLQCVSKGACRGIYIKKLQEK